VLQFCNEYRENKQLITYLKRAIARAEKTAGRSDRTVKNIKCRGEVKMQRKKKLLRIS
jgi:hypothetical protein